MQIFVTTPAQAIVDIHEVLVRVVDHLREDPGYTGENRDDGIAATEDLLRVLRTRTGSRAPIGSGAISFPRMANHSQA